MRPTKRNLPEKIVGISKKAKVNVQMASQAHGLPSVAQLRAWAETALSGIEGRPEITVRIVDEAESAELNQTYRHAAGPTNVLSFPFEVPAPLEISLLGDVVICAPVVAMEAREQNKTPEAHWAHMVVHGTLHLLGYDHLNDDDAERMESEERRVLAKLGFTDPYLESA